MRIVLASFLLFAVFRLPVNAAVPSESGSPGSGPRAPRLLSFQTTNPATLPIDALLSVHLALSGSDHPDETTWARKLAIQSSAELQLKIIGLNIDGTQTLSDLDHRIAALGEESDPRLRAAAETLKDLRDRLFLIEPLHFEGNPSFSDRLARARENTIALAQALIEYDPRERPPEELTEAARISDIAAKREFLHYLGDDKKLRETVLKAARNLQDTASQVNEFIEPLSEPRDSRPPSKLPLPDFSKIRSFADLPRSEAPPVVNPPKENALKKAPPHAAPDPDKDFWLLPKRFKVEEAYGFGPQFISGAELFDSEEETPGTTLGRLLQGQRFLFKSELDGFIPLRNLKLSRGESETPDILVYRSSPDDAQAHGAVRVQISKVTPVQVFITWYEPTADPSERNKTVWLKEILP